MRFLCLAYGDEDGWRALTADQQRDALAHDAAIRARGAVMSAVRPAVTSVRKWDGKLDVRHAPAQGEHLPLAGFSIIEADSVDEVIALVQDTPCARAHGVIEIYQFWDTTGAGE
jgi:hypothetical protein